LVRGRLEPAIACDDRSCSAGVSFPRQRAPRRAGGRPSSGGDPRERSDRYAGKLTSGQYRPADAGRDGGSHAAADTCRLRSRDGCPAPRRVSVADPRCPSVLAGRDPHPARDPPSRGGARPRRLPPAPAQAAL